MTPREFRQKQKFEFNHFQELTSTGINPNYANIELFAHQYHKHKLKLLGISDLVDRSELLKTAQDAYNSGYNDGTSDAANDILR